MIIPLVETIHSPQGTVREGHGHMVLRLEYNAIANAMNEKRENISSISAYLKENRYNDVIGNEIYYICEYKRAIGDKSMYEWLALETLLQGVIEKIICDGFNLLDGYLIK